jgi:hypothetical protein
MRTRITALALVAALAAAATGCGKDSEKGDPIPASVAGTLQQRLQVIQKQLDQGGGACADILDKTRPVVERDLQQVPSSVSRDVRRALRDSFDRLFELSSTQCQSDTNTDTTPTETDTTPTDTTPTETQPTETTPTQTTPTQTTPQQTNTQPPAPPGQEKNQNGGGAPAPQGNAGKHGKGNGKVKGKGKD